MGVPSNNFVASDPARGRPVLVFFLVLCTLGGFAWMFNQEPAAAPLTSKQKAERRVTQADDDASAALSKRVEGVSKLFVAARAGAPKFAEESLSWSGKWALLKDYLGIGNDAEHAQFLAKAFSENVLAGEVLKSALESAVKGYVADLEAIENQLIVQLRADLDDSQLANDAKPEFVQTDEAFNREYKRLAAELTQALIQDAQAEIGKQTASFVAWDVAMLIVNRIAQTVATELGVEATILGSGAASTLVTLGAGLVVGLIVDQIISWIMKEAGYDPEKEIATKVQESLNSLEKLLLDGMNKKPGLRGELERLRQARSQVQHAVVSKLTLEGAAQ